jgi:hypothetical protein
MIKVDSKAVEKMLDKFEDMGPAVMKESGKFFKQKTPIRSGNARSRTKTSGTKIEAKYGYAARLDEGWSRQAPKGMSEPTEKDIDAQVDKYIKRNS